MLKRSIAMALACGLLVLAAGCKPVREPWVRSQEQLAKERARPDQAQMELRNRLRTVQTDR